MSHPTRSTSTTGAAGMVYRKKVTPGRRPAYKAPTVLTYSEDTSNKELSLAESLLGLRPKQS